MIVNSEWLSRILRSLQLDRRLTEATQFTKRQKVVWILSILVWLMTLVVGVRSTMAGLFSDRCGDSTSPTLREVAHDVQIGTAVQAQLLHDQCYTQTLAKQFNLVTPENEMKFESVRGSSRDAGYNFHSADVIVDFATKHGMKVRGHTLVYDDGLLPRWLGQLSEKERDETRTQHIRKMIVQYGDRVTYWDVVNEALGLTGDIKRSVWGDTDEYVVGSFRTAREALSIANSHALLFYNDWGLEYPGPKFEGAYRLVKRLSDERLVDGVGFQCHLDSSLLDIKTLRANMDRIARLGLQVQVTEIDVRLPRDEWSSRKALDLQRDIYQQVLSACLSVPIKSAAGMATGGCSAFIMWGFTDAHSWIDLMQKDPMFINQGAALIFDKYYEPKPAYYGLVQTLKAAGERQAQ